MCGRNLTCHVRIRNQYHDRYRFRTTRQAGRPPSPSPFGDPVCLWRDPIPIAVIANAEGPTVLLMAGNHGDEYEGQIALGNLIREVNAEDVKGRLIVLPSANLPAARSGLRVSPLDNANLNRCFPPNAELGPTHEIADYLEQVLMPKADIFVDLHSGGSSLDYLPFVAASMTGDASADRRAWELMRAFGGPYGQLWNGAEGVPHRRRRSRSAKAASTSAASSAAPVSSTRTTSAWWNVA